MLVVVVVVVVVVTILLIAMPDVHHTLRLPLSSCLTVLLDEDHHMLCEKKNLSM